MKKFIKKNFKNLMFATIYLGGGDGGEQYVIEVPILKKWRTFEHIQVEIFDLLNILIGISSTVAVLMIIISGYILMTSAGDPDKADQGRKTLTGAVIGLAIVWIAGLSIMAILKALKME